MAILKDILYRVGIEEVKGSTLENVSSICIDSRVAEKAALFVALKGTVSDGHSFIAKAIENGANTIVCEVLPDSLKEGVNYIRVRNSAEALGFIANNFYGNPSKDLKLIGVTGTNGKTTVASLLFQMFNHLGYKCGLISTIEYRIGDEIEAATHTTPDAIKLNELMRKMVDQECTYCFMEVSSHALVQHRTTGLVFSGGIFTNLSHDHLDYHKTFKEYRDAKRLFFDQLPKDAFALTNLDDRNGQVMLQTSGAQKKTYALSSMADFRGRIIESTMEGLLLELDGSQVHALLIGEFNAYNLLAIYATASLLDVDKQEALTALSRLRTAEGRFDYIYDKDRKVLGIVDYAHTPDALEKILTAISAIRTRNETLITVVGCGGDRDKAKRPKMALIACKFSDKVILTSDNPRSEMPEQIIAEMEKGVMPQYAPKILSMVDRREAIKSACMMAASGDIILVAGKGHEKYQDIKGIKTPFDDKQELQTALDAQEYKR